MQAALGGPAKSSGQDSSGIPSERGSTSGTALRPRAGLNFGLNSGRAVLATRHRVPFPRKPSPSRQPDGKLPLATAGGGTSTDRVQNIRSAGRSVPNEPTFAIARLIRNWLSLRALPIESLRNSTLNPQQSVLYVSCEIE